MQTIVGAYLLTAALAIFPGLGESDHCVDHPVRNLSGTSFFVDTPPMLGLRLPSKPTTVLVFVNSHDYATKTLLLRSSGDARSDKLALRMAANALYESATTGCKPISSTYTYILDWPHVPIPR